MIELNKKMIQNITGGSCTCRCLIACSSITHGQLTVTRTIAGASGERIEPRIIPIETCGVVNLGEAPDLSVCNTICFQIPRAFQAICT